MNNQGRKPTNTLNQNKPIKMTDQHAKGNVMTWFELKHFFKTKGIKLKPVSKLKARLNKLKIEKA